MISAPITDHKQVEILLKQVQFAWTALGKKNRSQDPLGEIVAEWNALTDEIVFSSNIGDREFNWLPKRKELVEKLTGKSFRNVPEMVTFRANWRIVHKGQYFDSFQYWMGAIESGFLDGTDFTITIGFRYPVPESQTISVCSWRINCSATRRGRDDVPFHFMIASHDLIPPPLQDLIDEIGIDEELEKSVREIGGSDVIDSFVSNRPRRAFSGVRDLTLFEKILTALKNVTPLGTEGGITIYCPLSGYGHFLTNDSPDPSDIVLELAQKEKMDRLLELILSSKSASDWELVINSASERNTCGAGWDRRGSVLEHHDTKIEVTRLRSGKKQHKVILHYHEGEYRIEIEDMNADSQAGRIFSGWGVPFH